MSVAQDRITTARDELDAHVRDIVRWHFDPATGCPFWLDYAQKLDFDPREKIQSYEDLAMLGHFEDEWLRGGPVRQWVPKAYADDPVYVFETGGSTGLPKYRINVNDFKIDYDQYSRTLSDEGFPRGADWLMLGPSGPRRLRLAVEHLAQQRGGICFMVDLDPRWVNCLIRDGKMRELEAYKCEFTSAAQPCTAKYCHAKGGDFIVDLRRPRHNKSFGFCFCAGAANGRYDGPFWLPVKIKFDLPNAFHLLSLDEELDPLSRLQATGGRKLGEADLYVCICAGLR